MLLALHDGQTTIVTTIAFSCAVQPSQFVEWGYVNVRCDNDIRRTRAISLTATKKWVQTKNVPKNK
jgi:hypothetical protein